MADLLPHSEPHPDVAGYLLGTLADEEAEAFLGHLEGCPACRRELEELAGLPALLGDVADTWSLPVGLEEQTFIAVEAAAVEDPRGAADESETPPEGAATLAPATITALGARRPGRPGRLLIAMAAAAAAVVVGVATLNAVRKSTPAPLATIRLISASGGPAHGVAVVRATPAGVTIDMTVDGLPPTPPGQMYTCWLVASDDTLAHPDRVSVGSFLVRGTSVHVHWTTAADLARFPHLGVTVEPDNGNPSHQGPKVLTTA
jgi:anti-sigma-K factor RskA